MPEINLKKLNKEFKTLLDEIKEFSTIVVYRHKSPDFDAFGSQMGLYAWLKLNFPNKEIHYVGESHQTFVPKLFPEPEVLNDEWYEIHNKKFLAICVDTGNKARLSEEHIDFAEKVIKIDHHPNVEPYGDLNIVYDELSSCSELLTLFVYSLPRKYKINADMCKYFYTGIVGDSGRFLYPSVSPVTLRLAAELIIGGADFYNIYNKMYETNWKMLEFKKFALNNYKFQNGVVYYILTLEDMEKLGIQNNEANLMLSEFRNIDNVDICVSISETKDPEAKYRVSLRSKTKVINGVAAQFRGGGHDMAAGATLQSLDEVPLLIKALEEC